MFFRMEDPELYKVGKSSRPLKGARMVARTMTGGEPPKTVYFLEMPFALTVETAAHQRLRRFRFASARGEEWYQIHSPKRHVRSFERSRAFGAYCPLHGKAAKKMVLTR